MPPMLFRICPSIPNTRTCWQRGRLLIRADAASRQKFELRVCTHKTCKHQGSKQISQFVRDLGLEQFETRECGCLGNCGNGPNVLLLGTPLSAKGMQLAHISTPARVAAALRTFCDIDVDAKVLKATELRLAGNAAARAGDLQKAVVFYTQALDLRPSIGMHLLLSNRSGAKLAAGDGEGALADATAAIECAPSNFTTAYVRQVEALLRLGRHGDAMEELLSAVDRCPEFASSGEYHMLVQHVKAAHGPHQDAQQQEQQQQHEAKAHS